MSAPGVSVADVLAVIGLAPSDVIAYFQRKGFQISWDWHEVLDAQHAQVFTVAKVTQLDILQDIHDALQKAIADAQPFAQFVAQLEPVLRSKGWWGTKELLDGETGEIIPVRLGSWWRLRTIYQTNMQSAFMAGRYKAMMEASDTHPYWQYVAVLDGRTRPSHRALHGRVYRHDDAFWATFYPPNGWGCRCRVRPVSAASLERQHLAVHSSDAEPIMEHRVGLSDGRSATVSAFRTTDPETGKAVVMRTDAGFNGNVGRAAWAPEAGRWRGAIGELAQQVWQ